MQLVVTEKPSVAQAISRVIGAGERKDGYMEGNNYIVHGASGIWWSLHSRKAMENSGRNGLMRACP